MKYAIVFILLGLVLAYYAAVSSVWALRLLLLSGGIAFAGVGLAYAFVGPRAFLKQPDGRLSPMSYIVYWPYHLLNWLSLVGFRRGGQERPFDKIVEGIYLGCRLNVGDVTAIEELGVKSVLDVTSEFSEIAPLRNLAYRNIPLLDTHAPSAQQLREGVQWIAQQAIQGPVYIHCALGHGRSATLVAAYLLQTGKANTVEEAIALIRLQRPRIGLHPPQLRALEHFVLKNDTSGTK